MYMKRRESSKQTKYAWGLMNTDETKQNIALQAGYSPSMSRVPQVIENTKGYKLALSKVAGEVNNFAMNVLFALQARDMNQEDTKTLLSALDVVSKATERYIPKEKQTLDGGLSNAFANVIDITPIYDKPAPPALDNPILCDVKPAIDDVPLTVV